MEHCFIRFIYNLSAHVIRERKESEKDNICPFDYSPKLIRLHACRKPD